MFTRRHLMLGAASGGAALGLSRGVPAWARTAGQGNLGIPTLKPTTQGGQQYDLTIGKFPVRINGRAAMAVGVNGTIPSPLLRFREGEEITLNVKNTLEQTSSIHWHGLLVPFLMDGVPGVTFPGIMPGETFQYKYSVPQNGTYWYHSHSGVQEPLGMYGPIIIDPKGVDPVAYDREYVMVLSDWSFTHPMTLFRKLKSMGDSFNHQKLTVSDFMRETKRKGFGATVKDRAAWNTMRMNKTDIADIGGANYTYLINGRGTGDNWNGVFTVGERVRLRIINASSMSMFNIRMPGLPMTVVAADGLNVKPLEVDEFQIGVAETYDVIIEPKQAKPYAFVAESIDRSGQVVATFGPRPNMQAAIPALRENPRLSMKDMGMDHSAMAGGSMAGMDHSKMDHSKMDHSKMGHGKMNMGEMDHSSMKASPMKVSEVKIKTGAGVANVAAMPTSRLDEPGIGLDDVGHRTLRYSQLRSLKPNPDTRAPDREIVLHLTSNMERYMWSFDGKKFSHVTDSIKLYQGERVRMTLINNTMMQHPIHLHGMFFDLVNGGGRHRPRKHTVIVKPGEKLSYDISADHVGDWAFHCHLFFHMMAGMFQVVSVLPMEGSPRMEDRLDHSKMDHSGMGHEMKPAKMDHSKMDHSKMGHEMKPTKVDHSKMDHSKMGHEMKPTKVDHSKMDHSKMKHGKMGGMGK